MQFQTIPSRSVSPLAPSVVTVGSFHAGKVWNIIPDEATLQLTTRFYDMEVQKLIDKRIREICRLPQLHNECFAPQFADSWATGVQAMAKALIDLLQ